MKPAGVEHAANDNFEISCFKDALSQSFIRKRQGCLALVCLMMALLNLILLTTLCLPKMPHKRQPCKMFFACLCSFWRGAGHREFEDPKLQSETPTHLTDTLCTRLSLDMPNTLTSKNPLFPLDSILRPFLTSKVAGRFVHHEGSHFDSIRTWKS